MSKLQRPTKYEIYRTSNQRNSSAVHDYIRDWQKSAERRIHK